VTWREEVKGLCRGNAFSKRVVNALDNSEVRSVIREARRLGT
jgi:hypothetical protein